jgi:hypothetical protein
MTTSATLIKRVVQQISPTEQFIRATDRAKEIRDAGRARLDAEYVERIEDARSRFLTPTEVPAQPPPAAID